ncbi:ATP-binding protein [Natrinema salinisoli]|uniref:ATP-binding protein n=1 Tax=Natrinema salinisoli TaxID=2878535 RepID=UPI001CF0CC62|nr:DUF87 domain-containing protein [Natrinema salinisoli]
MSSEIYRGNRRFMDLADRTHRRYLEPGDTQSEPPDYNQRVPIGRDKHTGELVEYDVADHDRIGIFGTTGAGKTTLAKAILSRLFKGGVKVLHASDIKNDFHDIDNEPGVSKELIDEAGFAPGEQRTPIPVELFMPRFLYNEYPNNPPYYLTPFTLGFQDISDADLKYLIPTNSTRQKVVLNNVLDAVPPKARSFPHLKQVIDEQEEAPKNVRRALKSNLRSLKQEQILSTRYQKDPLEKLDEQVVVLALENWDRYKRQGLELVEIYVALTLRRLKEQLRDGDLEGPVMVFADEAHAFCPAGDDSISKREFVDLVDLGRAYKVPMMFASQHPAQIPNEENSDRYDVLGSINHFFLAPNLPEKDWKQCLKASGLWRQYGNRDIWRDRFASMDQYEFMYLNKERGTHQVVQPLAPLCAHS